MINQIYLTDDGCSLLKNDKDNYFVGIKNNEKIEFKELIEKENELEEVSKRYVNTLLAFRELNNRIDLRSMFNTILYASSALLCAANWAVFTGEDKNVGFFVLCLNFVIFKNVLLMAYGSKNAIKKERDNLLREINEYKLLYQSCVDDVTKLEEVCGYSECPANDDAIRNMKNKCKKIYRIHS